MIREKIKDIAKDKKFYFFLLITIVFFGIFLRMEYATDTYSFFEKPAGENIKRFIESGRLITAAWTGISYIFRLSNEAIYKISYILGIICITLSQYKLYKIIVNTRISNSKSEIKHNRDINLSVLETNVGDILAVIVSIIVIINIFSIELCLYIEKGIMALSVLMSVLATEKIVEFFRENKKKSLIATLLYMTIAVCSYQGTIGIFVAISLAFIVRYSKNIKDFIVKNIITALCYGIPGIFNYIIVKFIYKNSRMQENTELLEKINVILGETKKLIVNMNLLVPKYFFAISVLTTIAIAIYIIVKNEDTEKNRFKKKFVEICAIIYILIGTVSITIVPQFTQNITQIWFPPRSTYPIASLFGIILIYVMISFEIAPKVKKLIIALLIIYLLVQYVSFNRISLDHYILNYMDEKIALQINDIVIEYEENTKNKISKIALYSDKAPSYSYPDLFFTKDTNIKTFYPSWSAVRIISMYVRHEIVEVEKDKEIELKFKEENWDYFDKNQIICDGDTLHLCVY